MDQEAIPLWVFLINQGSGILFFRQEEMPLLISRIVKETIKNWQGLTLDLKNHQLKYLV